MKTKLAAILAQCINIGIVACLGLLHLEIGFAYNVGQSNLEEVRGELSPSTQGYLAVNLTRVLVRWEDSSLVGPRKQAVRRLVVGAIEDIARREQWSALGMDFAVASYGGGRSSIPSYLLFQVGKEDIHGRPIPFRIRNYLSAEDQLFGGQGFNSGRLVHVQEISLPTKTPNGVYYNGTGSGGTGWVPDGGSEPLILSRYVIAQALEILSGKRQVVNLTVSAGDGRVVADADFKPVHPWQYVATLSAIVDALEQVDANPLVPMESFPPHARKGWNFVVRGNGQNFATNFDEEVSIPWTLSTEDLHRYLAIRKAVDFLPAYLRTYLLDDECLNAPLVEILDVFPRWVQDTNEIVHLLWVERNSERLMEKASSNQYFRCQN